MSIDIANFYNKRAKLYHKVYINWIGFDEALGTFLNANKGLLGDRPLKVLDLGCGSGIFTEQIYRHIQKRHLDKSKFDCIDFSDTMIKLLTERIEEKKLKNVQIIKLDLTEAEVPKDLGDFDLVVSSGLFEYLTPDQLRALLSQVKQRLTNDGIGIFFMTKRNLLTKLIVGVGWKSRLYKESELFETLRNAGLEYKVMEFVKPHAEMNRYGYMLVVKK